MTTLKLSFPELLAEVDKLTNQIKEALEINTFNPGQAEDLQELLSVFILPALATKADAIAYVLAEKLPTEITQLKEYRDSISSAIKQRELAVESLKSLIKMAHSRGQIEATLKGNLHTIKVMPNSKPTVTIAEDSDPATWGNSFQDLYETRIEYKPDKKAIADAAALGHLLPPGVTVSTGSQVRVTLKK